MNVELTDKEAVLIETVLGLDLDAMGLSPDAQRLARIIRKKLKPSFQKTAADTFADGVKEIVRRHPFGEPR
jgi:hypothetical protein